MFALPAHWQAVLVLCKLLGRQADLCLSHIFPIFTHFDIESPLKRNSSKATTNVHDNLLGAKTRSFRPTQLYVRTRVHSENAPEDTIWEKSSEEFSDNPTGPKWGSHPEGILEIQIYVGNPFLDDLRGKRYLIWWSRRYFRKPTVNKEIAKFAWWILQKERLENCAGGKLFSQLDWRQHFELHFARIHVLLSTKVYTCVWTRLRMKVFFPPSHFIIFACAMFRQNTHHVYEQGAKLILFWMWPTAVCLFFSLQRAVEDLKFALEQDDAEKALNRQIHMEREANVLRLEENRRTVGLFQRCDF